MNHSGSGGGADPEVLKRTWPHMADEGKVMQTTLTAQHPVRLLTLRAWRLES